MFALIKAVKLQKTATTPMIRQYLEIKEKHQDAILFYRLGDFYEMFFEDAVEASKILEITLTTRNRNSENPVPLCGIPYHSASSYIAKIIESGRKVAICEQVEDPKAAKGIVKREVTRIITPGLVVDENNLSSKDSNYLAALNRCNDVWGVAYLDLSTGDFRVTEIDGEAGHSALEDELLKIEPKELLMPERNRDSFNGSATVLSHTCPVTYKEDFIFNYEEAEAVILNRFKLNSLDGIGCADMSAGIRSAGAILNYLNDTQSGYGGHIDRLKPYSTASYMQIDSATKRNLEIITGLMDGADNASLYGILGLSETAMGARKLKDWINYPLQDINKINKRLDAVSEFKERPSIRKCAKEILGTIYDIERLTGRIALGRGNPRDIIALGNSVRKIPELKELLKDFTSPLIQELYNNMDHLPELEELIFAAIDNDPPVNITEGGIIKKGYNPDLDELRNISFNGKGALAALEAEEKKNTGISSLKIRYNKVFGYYIEVTKANISLVPDNYIRKQTLTNAERYITEELKQFETKILGAEERISELEYSLFINLRDEVAGFSAGLKKSARFIAVCDAIISLAEAADRYNYVRPLVNDTENIKVIDGRHPVVERLSHNEHFVPNDTMLDCDENQIVIITGPNMAGKSTYIRQVALITLMAHMGSFVPAGSAEIGLVDRIFTRVGASDNLAKGQSTFMVEMNETANILNNATRRSLIVLDEIGRGTSTFDGLSIAWSVAEHIHDCKRLGTRTLFATHYHELTELSLTKERVKNYNVAIKEWNGSIIFLRKIVPGGASRSYGIEVARLAGLPADVIKRAFEILANLEGDELDGMGMPRLAFRKSRSDCSNQHENLQMNLFIQPGEHILEEIRNLDISNMSPLEALNRLNRYKEEIG